jgi:hypothetical protein
MKFAMNWQQKDRGIVEVLGFGFAETSNDFWQGL